MVNRWIRMLIVVLLPAWPVHAACNVSAQVSATRIHPGQAVQLTIQASGTTVSEPDLSVLTEAGWQILGGPAIGRSYQVMVINGQMTQTQTLTWTYSLRSDKEGQVQIPAVPLTVDGQQCVTSPVNITVSRDPPPRDQPGSTPRRDEQPTIEDLAFVTMKVDRERVFQGERLVLTLSIYVLDRMGVDIEIPRNLPLPDLGDFLQRAQNRTVDRDTVRGLPYRVQRLEQVLYPVQAGALTIPAWNWQGRVFWPDRSLFGQSSAVRDFYAPPITLTVEPLPPAPPEFSGAVGSYRAESVFPRETLTVGTPVQWAITITGTGNPDTVSAPKIPSLPWAHLTGPDIDLQGPDGGEQTKIFTYQLTPLVSGEQELPEIQYVFFAPPLKQYKTIRIAARKLTVLPDGGDSSGQAASLVAYGGSATASRRQVEEAPVVIPLVKDLPASLSSRGTPAWIGRMSLLAAIVLPPMLWGLILGISLRKKRLLTDRAYARKARALTRFRDRIEQAGRDEDPGGCIYRALADLVSDLVNAREEGLTTDELIALLNERVDGEMLPRLETLLRKCERARYTGRNLSTDEVRALRDAAEDLAGVLMESLR
mgnify:FL=1